MSQNPIVTFTVAGRGTIKAELYPETALIQSTTSSAS